MRGNAVGRLWSAGLRRGTGHGRGAAKFCELVCCLVVQRGCPSGVAFGLPQHAPCLPQRGVPRAAGPHPSDRLRGLDPAAGLVQAAGAGVGDGGGHPESHGTGWAHVAPFEPAVGVFDAPGRRVRVRRGGDERPVYPHGGMRLQPALFGHAEAVLQQPDSVASPAGGYSRIGEPVHGQCLSRCGARLLV
jgi:hypothetical protein